MDEIDRLIEKAKGVDSMTLSDSAVEFIEVILGNDDITQSDIDRFMEFIEKE